MCFAVINVSRTFQRYSQFFVCLLDRQNAWCGCDVVVGCDISTSCCDDDITLSCDCSSMVSNIRALCRVLYIIDMTGNEAFILAGTLCDARQFDFTAGVCLRC